MATEFFDSGNNNNRFYHKTMVTDDCNMIATPTDPLVIKFVIQASLLCQFDDIYVKGP